MALREFDTNPVAVPPLADDLFGPSGYVVADPRGLLATAGAEGALSHGLHLVNRGVQKAAVGAIQDPAGSAVSQPSLIGGGASGVIYAAFPDLDPIPDIQPRSAIFNSSTGGGRRVLHSFSPRLEGKPSDASERRQALEDLANTYANAILAFNDRAPDLGTDGALLNLVPVAAVIYGGGFPNPAFPKGHLDPSYSIPAVYLAVATLQSARTPLPALSLSYYDSAVFAAAQAVQSALAGS